MERKHWVVGWVVVVVVAAVAYAAGYASGPDSPAHMVPRTADEWTALAAWLALAAALAAAWFAKGQADEARKIRIEQAQPEVVAYLEQDPDIQSAVEIVIANLGATSAHDVVVTTKGAVRAVSAPGPEAPPDHVQIPDRFSTLAPGQRWRTMWDWAPDRMNHLELVHELQATLCFDYLGVDKKPIHHEFVLDWSQVQVRTFAEKKTVHHLTREVAKLRQTIERRDRQSPMALPGPEPVAPAAGMPDGRGPVARLYARILGGSRP